MPQLTVSHPFLEFQDWSAVHSVPSLSEQFNELHHWNYLEKTIWKILVAWSCFFRFPCQVSVATSPYFLKRAFFLRMKIPLPVRPTHCTQFHLHRPSRTSCDVTWWPMINPWHDKLKIWKSRKKNLGQNRRYYTSYTLSCLWWSGSFRKGSSQNLGHSQVFFTKFKSSLFFTKFTMQMMV